MLQGRTALVTGGSRGIGAACARALAAAGAQVVVTGRASGELDAVAAEIGGTAIVADLLDRDATDDLVATLVDRGVHIDVLVNNAGIAESAPLVNTDDKVWDMIMETNATAPFRLARAMLPTMVKAGWGRIVTIASNAGLTGYGYSAAYCASKHAVIGMTRAVAIDIARTGVTINALCPGWVQTAMSATAADRIAAKTGRAVDDAMAALVAMTPQRRLIDPSEVAHALIGLCAHEARGIHGQCIVIDGGQVMK